LHQRKKQNAAILIFPRSMAAPAALFALPCFRGVLSAAAMLIKRYTLDVKRFFKNRGTPPIAFCGALHYTSATTGNGASRAGRRRSCFSDLVPNSCIKNKKLIGDSRKY
jgi:hypothetical protein